MPELGKRGSHRLLSADLIGLRTAAFSSWCHGRCGYHGSSDYWQRFDYDFCGGYVSGPSLAGFESRVTNQRNFNRERSA